MASFAAVSRHLVSRLCHAYRPRMTTKELNARLDRQLEQLAEIHAELHKFVEYWERRNDDGHWSPPRAVQTHRGRRGTR